MKTVLVVDDFASVRFYHQTLLQHAGYTVVAAANGVEALAALARQPVDLVMLDLLMPQMGGQEFVRRLRSTPAHARLPVVIISSEGLQAPLDLLRADPACHLLTKPILPAALLQEIQHWLG